MVCAPLPQMGQMADTSSVWLINYDYVVFDCFALTRSHACVFAVALPTVQFEVTINGIHCQ
jgi:hypothetical protein